MNTSARYTSDFWGCAKGEHYYTQPSPLPPPPLPQGPPLPVTEFAPPPQPSLSPPDAPLPSRAHASAAAAADAAAALQTGSIVVTLGATALTTLIGPGGQFGLGDVVRAGGVAAAAPPAAAATAASDSDDVPTGQRVLVLKCLQVFRRALPFPPTFVCAPAIMGAMLVRGRTRAPNWAR